jgi:hypothetical protein
VEQPSCRALTPRSSGQQQARFACLRFLPRCARRLPLNDAFALSTRLQPIYFYDEEEKGEEKGDREEKGDKSNCERAV